YRRRHDIAGDLIRGQRLWSRGLPVRQRHGLHGSSGGGQAVIATPPAPPPSHPSAFSPKVRPPRDLRSGPALLTAALMARDRWVGRPGVRGGRATPRLSAGSPDVRHVL